MGDVGTTRIAPSKRFQEVVARWQTKLLDLSRRNRLLYFRPSRSSVRIAEYPSDDISEALSASRRGLSFDFAERRRKPLDLFADEEQQSETEPEVVMTPGDLSSDCQPLELQRRLRSLQKKDLEWEQEQGMNVLFLAMGFLEWVDEDGLRAKAPLLLTPCNLRRKSPRDPFYLVRDSDDVETNGTLAHLLSQQGIGIPDYQDEKPSEYLKHIKSRISKRPDWSVADDLYLGAFPFNKMAMWQDLERLRLKGTGQPLVLQMADELRPNDASHPDGAGSPFPSESELEGGRLDDLFDLRDQFTVLTADYSQLMAIEAVRDGRNLVIHGPPGTGKSQTITNLIAGLIADGKTVLFVSEKRAALDVVKRRLEKCRLGVFCLDLHSHFARKVAVYKQFQDSLRSRRTARRTNEEDIEELTRLRSRLNALARAAHRKVDPLGRSAYEVSGIFASVQEVPAVQLDTSRIGEMDPKLYGRIRELSYRLAQRPTEFREHHTSGWRPLTLGAYRLDLPEEVRLVTKAAVEDVSRVRKEAERTARLLGVAEPTCAAEVDRLAQICLRLHAGPVVQKAWLTREAVNKLRNVTRVEEKHQASHGELCSSVDASFGSPRDDLKIAKLHKQLERLKASPGVLQIVLGSEWENRPLQQVGDAVKRRSALEESLHQLASQCDKLAQLLSCPPFNPGFPIWLL